MQKWTSEIEERFTELRLRKLSGHLSAEEQQELDEIRALVNVVESETFTPALQKLESERATLQGILSNHQKENSELMQLLNQQSMLIADTKHWLKEFEQRYSAVQSAFSRLTV